MKIKNTSAEALHPWPEETFLQGGKSGLVLRRTERGGSYTTAFVEAGLPGQNTFIRGEGETLAEAEADAWDKYQRWLNCDGSGQHGPWEARGYENGSGFCLRCGAWGSKVLKPSQAYEADRMAGQLATAHFGEDIMFSPWFRTVISHYEQSVLALWNGTPWPEPPADFPTKDQWEEWKSLADADPDIRDAEVTAILDAFVTAVSEEDDESSEEGRQ